MTDICSVWAYQDITESGYVGERQGMFLSILVEAYPSALTGKQIVSQVERKFGAYFSKFGLGSRLAELTEMGFIKKHDKVVCEHTHQTVNRWVYTGSKFPRRKEVVSRECPHCGGCGVQTKEEYVADED